MAVALAEPKLALGARKGDPMAKAIVVGYDGSDNSGDGLALAAQLARLTDARLLVAFVYAGKSPFEGAVAASVGVTMRE